MESRAKFLGHAIHPMLMVFPLALLSFGVLFDIIYLFTENPAFATVGYWSILGGVIGGLAAAIPGFWDFMHIPDGTRAKRVGLVHGIGNFIVLILFGAAWLLRTPDPINAPTTLGMVLELLGAGLALVTGWLGGELVERLGVGVDEGAHLDAPSSLSSQPAVRGRG